MAITNKGPCLIEGNDNWCKTLFQIPTAKGLRFLADNVANMKIVYN
ncbi:hypothetical protein THIOM_002971 [Candidatus Thiomargarita nelsonii]|uniref:Uncharacterized protein n=1 Tax=Candidatus Thiomargarita nelsonii TaxID=1003181 RepID=A0A176S033_9GAMM|nr:hypothetical protein THIOM_002971 [Candidatus Thiomargarita nelsonii]